MMQKNHSGERPLLTIAIPTYDRSVYLDQLLGILLQELADEDRIELVISDNASADDTPSLVEDYRKRGLSFRYIRNKINMGSDGNFLQCFEQATGKYLWLIGDDDIIVPGSIRRILTLLSNNNYDLIYLSPYSFRDDYIKERTSDRFGRTPERLIDGFELIQKVGIMISFMSVIIIDRDYCAPLFARHSRDHLGTHLVHLGWICPILATSSNILIVWERMVGGRRDNCRGWGACQVFGPNLKQIADATLADRRDIADLLCNQTLRVWFPGTLMNLRLGRGSPLDSENMREVLEPHFSGNWRYWTHIYPIIALPLGLARTWNAVIQLTNRIERLFHTILSLASYRNKHRRPSGFRKDLV